MQGGKLMAVDIRRNSTDIHTPPPPLVGHRSTAQTGDSGGHNMVLSFILMVLAALVAGGSVYYGLKTSYDAEAKELKDQITSLQRQVAAMETAVAPPQPQTTGSPSPTPTPSPSASATPANKFDVTKAKVGDKVAGMTIKTIEPYDKTKGNLSGDNAKVTFTGEATVTGNYAYDSETGLSLKDPVCIHTLDASSADKIPMLSTDTDNYTAFCFSNQETAKPKFAPVGSKGVATVVIKNFILNMSPSGTVNTAEFVKLITVKTDQ
jgi:hypothetical protein